MATEVVCIRGRRHANGLITQRDLAEERFLTYRVGIPPRKVVPGVVRPDATTVVQIAQGKRKPMKRHRAEIVPIPAINR
jgi:hypothetical protein